MHFRIVKANLLCISSDVSRFRIMASLHAAADGHDQLALLTTG